MEPVTVRLSNFRPEIACQSEMRFRRFRRRNLVASAVWFRRCVPHVMRYRRLARHAWKSARENPRLRARVHARACASACAGAVRRRDRAPFEGLFVFSPPESCFVGLSKLYRRITSPQAPKPSERISALPHLLGYQKCKILDFALALFLF